jgi:hypothetical protein
VAVFVDQWGVSGGSPVRLQVGGQNGMRVGRDGDGAVLGEQVGAVGMQVVETP